MSDEFSSPLPFGRDGLVDTSEVKSFKKDLRGEWTVLWRDRFDDRVRAEGVASQDSRRRASETVARYVESHKQ